MVETKNSLYAEARVETLTNSVGEVFHKVNRLNSILNDIENKIIIRDSPMEVCKQSEPQAIQLYVYASDAELEKAITLAERIKEIL